jgi:hypothetical protein
VPSRATAIGFLTPDGVRAGERLTLRVRSLSPRAVPGGDIHGDWTFRFPVTPTGRPLPGLTDGRLGPVQVRFLAANQDGGNLTIRFTTAGATALDLFGDQANDGKTAPPPTPMSFQVELLDTSGRAVASLRDRSGGMWWIRPEPGTPVPADDRTEFPAGFTGCTPHMTSLRIDLAAALPLGTYRLALSYGGQRLERMVTIR